MPVPVGDARTRPEAALVPVPVLVGVDAEPDPWRRILGILARDPDRRAPGHGDGYVVITYHVG